MGASTLASAAAQLGRGSARDDGRVAVAESTAAKEVRRTTTVSSFRVGVVEEGDEGSSSGNLNSSEILHVQKTSRSSCRRDETSSGSSGEMTRISCRSKSSSCSRSSCWLSGSSGSEIISDDDEVATARDSEQLLPGRQHSEAVLLSSTWAALLLALVQRKAVALNIFQRLWWCSPFSDSPASNNSSRQCSRASGSSSPSAPTIHSRCRQPMKMSTVACVALCLLFVCGSDLGKLVSCSPSIGSGSSGNSFNLNGTRKEVVWSGSRRGEEGIYGGSVGGRAAVGEEILDELEQQVPTGGHFTPMWAVEIPGGSEVADSVARHHGFVNHGRIFGDYYYFHHQRVHKRSADPSLHHQLRLDKDARVLEAIQQVAKSRQKRDFTRPRRTFELNDPRWQQMWYLNRGSGLDMNVIPAWKQGITGKGIVVTILDDGLEKDHPDLTANYDPKASYDMNGLDDDPQPFYDIIDSNRHGTRCAGEVAATANNSLCAVGIAFGASVGGVRMLDGDVTDAVEAKSLSLNPQHIDIYSASWGPDDDGKTVDGPGALATKAFIEGVTHGRGGKGSIFIWASGNGGREHDNCNCDGYTNSIWTLSISSATEEGSVPWYSEKCSSTLATTYSSGGQGEKQIVTTDLHHACTASHTGTSASAPLAAGIAALVLEANPQLTWRDLQHIVVRTAKPGNLDDPTWSRNGVGRMVSHSFGYGLMDASAMVNLARTWQTVPEQQKCEINAPQLDRVIGHESHIVLQLNVEHCRGVNYLEHVQAKLTLNTQRRGVIQIYLTSPSGTRVTLLTSRDHDLSRAGFTSWPFMSVHTWGEAPQGSWLLEIRNEGKYTASTVLKNWVLVLYGTSEPIDINDPVSSPRPILNRTAASSFSPAAVSIPSNGNVLRPSHVSSSAIGSSAVATGSPASTATTMLSTVVPGKSGKGKIKNQMGQGNGKSPARNKGQQGIRKNNKQQEKGKESDSGVKKKQQMSAAYTNGSSQQTRKNGGGGGSSGANGQGSMSKPTFRPPKAPRKEVQQAFNELQRKGDKTLKSSAAATSEKTIKAPKQVKENNSNLRSQQNQQGMRTSSTTTSAPQLPPRAGADEQDDMMGATMTVTTTTGPSTASTASQTRLTKLLFEKYNRIQQFYPELHPYVPPISEAEKKASMFLAVSNPNSKKKQVGGDGLGGIPPFRENGRIIFFSDPDFYPATTKPVQRINPVTVNEQQRNAQISDWRLILYGTEQPAQATDGKAINIDVPNSIEKERSSDRWLNEQQVDGGGGGNVNGGLQRAAPENVTDRGCLDFAPNKFCIECNTHWFLFNGSCYADICPIGSYLLSKEEAALKRKQLLKNKRSEEEDEEGDLDTGKGGVVASSSSPPQLFDSLADILPTRMQDSASALRRRHRAIMKPQIQNICGGCHSTCHSCTVSNSEANCLSCQDGLAFIANRPLPSPQPQQHANDITTGVCVSPITQSDKSFIDRLNAGMFLTAVATLFALGVVFGLVWLFLRLTRRKSKLRDSYAYDRVNETGLLSEYDDEVLDDAFLTYKQLKSKFTDGVDDEEEEEEEVYVYDRNSHLPNATA